MLKTFPDDEPMRRAVASCRGLRLLRQDPWECLASFILSSTKQIVQIRQIVALLCERFGEPVSLSSLKGGESRGENSPDQNSPLEPLNRSSRREEAHSKSEAESQSLLTSAATEVHGKAADYFETQLPSPRLGGAREKTRANPLFRFPTPERLAACSEAELRDCKMGFRAPCLLAAARAIADGKFDLKKIRALDYAAARAELMKLRGVGGKIADCVLLFAYGFDSAFPVDVWIERALQELYFPRRRASDKRLRHFAATHFGPHAGYAQQYLFHYMRTKMK